ncbi:uncharacterized protein EV154DRAFT_166458 [Mucor mucedo]|uniref:uncharacterized protein n=1 Tax=Mucor mucedo TaxID=29922 RepID=UPI00221FC44F|nr:uncharacterized protein EV154DRAFT_166458 [Mucor mucedo]KAI7865119.1 hypothetical protein EV154DRAFT_166458 [Mucor mucedo]
MKTFLFPFKNKMTITEANKRVILHDSLDTEMDIYMQYDEHSDRETNTFYDLRAAAHLSPLPDSNEYEAMDIVSEEEPAFMDAKDEPVEIKHENLIEELALENSFNEDMTGVESTNGEQPSDEAVSRIEIAPVNKVKKPVKKIVKPAKERSLTYAEMIKKVQRETDEVESKQKENREGETSIYLKSLYNNSRSPDVNDPNYHCRVCEITFSGRYTYGFHLIHMHNIPDGVVFKEDIRTQHSELAHLKVILYCPNCNKHFSSYITYMSHMSLVHTGRWPIPGRATSNPYMMPDVNDRKFFCRVCRDYFNTKVTYQYHLICVHSMTRESVFSEETEATPEEQQTCDNCQKCFHTKNDHDQHRLQYRTDRVAKPTRKRRINPQPHLPPELDDPNFYCRTCDYAYKNVAGFKRHLNAKHNITARKVQSPTPPSPATTTTETTIETAREFSQSRSRSSSPVVIITIRRRPPRENYCKDCDRTLSSKYSYVRHCRRFHASA